MRIFVFIVAFVLGALLSVWWIDENTVCPTLQEGQSFQVRVTAWPPLALECEGRTYVPWWEWLCVAISALGVALFSFSLSRITLSFVLFVGGVLGWFAGSPF
jgi:hypothetical protein